MPRPIHLHIYVPPERDPLGKLLEDIKAAPDDDAPATIPFPGPQTYRDDKEHVPPGERHGNSPLPPQHPTAASFAPLAFGAGAKAVAGDPQAPKAGPVTASILDGLKDTAPPRERALPPLLRDRIRVKLVDALEAAGHDRAAANRVVAELEHERPLLDWLLHGGFDKLLALALELLKLVA